MTKQHRAMPEQWETIELYAGISALYSCIIELRVRIEALDAAHPHQDKMDRLIAIDRDDPSNSPVAADTFRALCSELVELSAPTDSISQLAERLQKLNELATRARIALAHPEPVVVPVAVSDALIKAECALSDVAEGEPECGWGDPAQWVEQRCAETLAIIRPVMQLHKIRTSEWPPQPMPTPANNTRDANR